MPAELFVRNADGTVSFTQEGQFAAYYQTMQRLISHYMKAGLKYPQEQIDEKLQRFKLFAQDNFVVLDDYLEKLPTLAAFIGEKNASRFGSFVGKNFFSALEKVKKNIEENEFTIETPQVFAYDFPSKKILAFVRSDFEKARALPWPLPEEGSEQAVSNAEAIIKEETSQDKKTSAVGVSSPSVKKVDTTFLSPSQKTASMPSREMQQLFGTAFAQAQALSWPLPEEGSEPLPVQAQEENEEVFDPSELAGILAQAENPSLAAESSPSASPVQNIDSLPSRSFFSKLEKIFLAAQELHDHFAFGEPSVAQAQTSTKGGQTQVADVQQRTNIMERQLTLKDFAILMNHLSRFTKNKDNAGYKQWQAKLNIRYKVSLHLNKLVSAEQKSVVHWKKELASLSEKTYIELDILKKYLQEIRAYRLVLQSIRQAMNVAVKNGADGKAVQGGYSALINIFENNDTIDSKSVLLKMHLLTIQPPQAKEVMSNILIPLLEKIRETYPLD